MTFGIILINPAILPKSMGFDCLRHFDSKNIALRERVSDSDSLVNDQILSEILSKSERECALPIKNRTGSHDFLIY